MEHDIEHDVAYFAIRGAAVARQEKLGDGRVVDYAGDGSVVGVEFFLPSRGLDLTGVPHAAQIARLARRRGLRVLGTSESIAG